MICKKCGECCKKIEVYFMNPLDDSELLVLNYKGGVVSDGKVVFNSPCKFLTEQNECSIYDTRPLHCRRYFCHE